jgi:hypothetical protein
MKKGVVIGQKNSLYQEILMQTPKPFYAQHRRIYHSELLICPRCGELLVGCNYLAWDKIRLSSLNTFAKTDDEAGRLNPV